MGTRTAVHFGKWLTRWRGVSYQNRRMDSTELVARLQQSRYGESTAEILRTCKAAEALNETFPTARARAQWLKDYGIHRDTWGKLLAIARAETLQDPDIATLLPASFSTLAVLSRLNRQEFEEARRQGLITPRLGQRRLELWRREREQQRSPAPKISLLPVVIAVKPDLDANEEFGIRTALTECLETKKFDAELLDINSLEALEEEALRQWQRMRLYDATEELNQCIAPTAIRLSDLEKPMSELKDICSALTSEQWDRVYALKNAHGALFSSYSQQRYASRNRWQKAAATDPYARELYEKLIGNPQDDSNDKSC
jgi:hypothetical protein